MREATEQVLKLKVVEYIDVADRKAHKLYQDYRATWREVEELRRIMSGVLDIDADLGGDGVEIREGIAAILEDENLIELIFPEKGKHGA